MTKRERIYASIRRQPLDALPWQFDLTGRLIERLQVYYGTTEVHAAIGDHLVWGAAVVPQGGEVSQDGVGPGQYRDEFGAVWQRDAPDRNVGDWGELVASPIAAPSLAGYHFPDASQYGRWRTVPDVRKRYPDHFLAVAGIGLFENGWALCGFENYLTYLGGEPKFIEALNEGLTDYSCQLTRQLKGMGVDGIRFGDDWAMQCSLMLRADTWRRLFKPYYRRIYAEAKAAGLVVMIHSCGQVTELLPDLIELGVEVVHPLQPEAMDVAHCQREFGRDLTFWGGIGSQSTIPRGTADDNRREARLRLRQFAAGGYILAPSGAAPTETPVENIAAIVEVAKAQLG